MEELHSTHVKELTMPDTDSSVKVSQALSFPGWKMSECSVKVKSNPGLGFG